MKRILSWVAFLPFIICLISFPSCGNQSSQSKGQPTTQPAPPHTVTVILSWSPVSEHAFLYYGINEGFFRANGLEVKVLPSKGSSEVATALEAGTVQFGFISGDVLVTSRVRGIRIRALATTLHSSPTSIYSLQQVGIKSPLDLRGKRIGVLPQSSVYPQYRLMLKKQGIDPSSIIEVPTAGSPQELLDGYVQAALHYTHLLPVYLRADGHPVNEILLKDYGVDVVSSSLATTDKMLERQPQTVQAFVDSFLRSLDASFTKTNEALNALLEAERSLRPELTRPSLERANELIFTDEAKMRGPGYISIDDWQRTQNTLFDAGQIKVKLDPSYFFIDTFLNAYRERHPFK